MAYTPTVWATGDVITAEKLNNMESGIVNGNIPIYMVTVTNIDYENLTFTCDKTWNEIKAAYENGKHIILRQLYVGTLYRYFEIVALQITSETGALRELQFSRIDLRSNGGSQSFFIMSENANSLSDVSFNIT